MDALDEIFAEIRENLPDVGVDWYDEKEFLVYVVKNDINDGYRLARTMSPVARAMYDLTGGLNLYGNKHIGQDAIRLFKEEDDGRPYPERSLFVYPEHDMVAWQQQEFVDRLCKRSDLKQVIIITTCPIIVSDFFACQVRVLQGFDGEEAPPSKRLHIL